MTTQTRNEVLLEGLALAAPEWSHENHETQFYRFFLQVPRLSGQADVLPILLPQALLSPVTAGAPLRVVGQLRSFNNRSGVGSRLVLTVYAQSIEPCAAGAGLNQIQLSGALCKPPVFRRTPLGRSICDLMLASPRRYGRADYLPVIAWGQLAVQASRLQVGDSLTLEGRVQSRTYRKVTDGGAEERVAYEVSMMHLLETEVPPSSDAT
ncbi:single-stranded DNA-binding protein [Oscillibacter sp.]|uniref:single-stranded DNA-binding protein n=1 Tax=Oscillibacter sp. TaxID=1945593 RepID=UPI00262E46E5|nr:single-stranded DNA-binding protein [Oscillibacter sp.]MDD3347081.1 single-stranded DNA-binding protein [Oscillibacter sp.]